MNHITLSQIFKMNRIIYATTIVKQTDIYLFHFSDISFQLKKNRNFKMNKTVTFFDIYSLFLHCRTQSLAFQQLTLQTNHSHLEFQ